MAQGMIPPCPAPTDIHAAMAKFPLLRKLLVPSELEEVIDATPKQVGSLDYDPWGFNYDTVKLGLAAFKPFYEKYFRVETHGLENIPTSGRCLIICNHSGQLPIDAMMIGYAVATNPMGPRAPRAMMERFLPTIPYIGNLLNNIGAVVGEPANCAKMLDTEEVILVFPEGVRGTGKAWNKRYQLQRFGLGFMHLAIEHDTPIVPVGIVGCEESMPAIGHLRKTARKIGLPYIPIGLPFPLPTKVIINIGEPMRFGQADSEDEIRDNVETVKSRIEALIAKGLAERKGVFA